MEGNLMSDTSNESTYVSPTLATLSKVEADLIITALLWMDEKDEQEYAWDLRDKLYADRPTLTILLAEKECDFIRAALYRADTHAYVNSSATADLLTEHMYEIMAKL